MPELGILHVTAVGGDALPGALAPRSKPTASSSPTRRRIAAEPARRARRAVRAAREAARAHRRARRPAAVPGDRARYDDASWVGYRLAELLPLPLSIKQSMLEINDGDVRLALLRKFLQQQGLV